MIASTGILWNVDLAQDLCLLCEIFHLKKKMPCVQNQINMVKLRAKMNVQATVADNSFWTPIWSIGYCRAYHTRKNVKLKEVAYTRNIHHTGPKLNFLTGNKRKIICQYSNLTNRPLSIQLLLLYTHGLSIAQAYYIVMYWPTTSQQNW